MGLMIDTDVLIFFERHPDRFRQFLEGRQVEELSISVITASELLHGVHRAGDSAIRARRETFVKAVLAQIFVIEIDLFIARRHAQLWAELARIGTMIGLHDSWIAATCLAHDLTLLTLNRHEFASVPELRMLSLET